jgi:hypothetical protein
VNQISQDIGLTSLLLLGLGFILLVVGYLRLPRLDRKMNPPRVLRPVQAGLHGGNQRNVMLEIMFSCGNER